MELRYVICPLLTRRVEIDAKFANRVEVAVVLTRSVDICATSDLNEEI